MQPLKGLSVKLYGFGLTFINRLIIGLLPKQLNKVKIVINFLQETWFRHQICGFGRAKSFLTLIF